MSENNHFSFRRFVEYAGLLAVCLLLAIIIYGNTFHVPFHFDDVLTIVENPYVKSVAKIPNLWHADPSRFLTYLSFSLNYHFGALDVKGYHVFNFTVHIATAFVFFIFVLLTMKQCAKLKIVNESLAKRISVLSVLIFLCHPIQTQAVTYISQRSTMMATFFYLLTIIFYITYKNNGRRGFYFTALLMTGIGLFTKPIIITLPFALFLYEICFYNFYDDTNQKVDVQKIKKSILLILPFFVLVLAVPFLLMFWKYKVFDPTRLAEITTLTSKITRSEYLMTQFNVIITYLRLLIFPVNQNLDYDFPIAKNFFVFPTWLSFLAIIGIIYLAKRLFKRQRLISFGIFWFFVTISLESSIFPISDVINEHRLYLPMVGLSILFAYCLGAIAKKQYVYVPLFGLIVILLSVNTYQRNLVWGDRVGFLVDVIEKSPEKARVYNNLGIAYYDKGDYKAAEESLKKAIALDPKFVHPYNNLANAYFEQGKVEEAMTLLKQAIALDPKFAGPYYNMGNYYLQQGDVELAEKNYIDAINAKPNFVLAIIALGKLKAKSGDFTKANFFYRSALHYDPGSAEAHYHLGDLYLNYGKYEEAITFYQEALKRNPNLAGVHNNMANLYDMQGRYDDAAASYRKAIQLKPTFANAYFNYSNVLQKQGKNRQSMEMLKIALKLYSGQGNTVMADKVRSKIGSISRQ